MAKQTRLVGLESSQDTMLALTSKRSSCVLLRVLVVSVSKTSVLLELFISVYCCLVWVYPLHVIDKWLTKKLTTTQNGGIEVKTAWTAADETVDQKKNNKSRRRRAFNNEFQAMETNKSVEKVWFWPLKNQIFVESTRKSTADMRSLLRSTCKRQHATEHTE
jgi:hypothetical protein